MGQRHSFDYFIESIQKAISLNQLNEISIEFDKVFLSGNLKLLDEQWDKFTVVLNTKINLLTNQSSLITNHQHI